MAKMLCDHHDLYKNVIRTVKSTIWTHMYTLLICWSKNVFKMLLERLIYNEEIIVSLSL